MEHFAKAPIHEALLDVQVVLPPDSEKLDFKLFGQGLEDRFPECQERVQFVQSFQLAADQKQIPPVKNVEGYLFTSNAHAKIVQARREGFTFNKLRPYTKWDDFSTEARELWQRYVDFARPAAVKRLGLRYINRIEVPPDVGDPRDLCLLFPEFPTGVPQAWFEFFQRFASARDDGALSIVTLAIDNPLPPGKVAIILDIDVAWLFQTGAPPETQAIWPQIDKLRALKNDIFNASLTSKAKELFR